MYPSQSHRDAFGINNNAVYFSSVLTKVWHGYLRISKCPSRETARPLLSLLSDCQQTLQFDSTSVWAEGFSFLFCFLPSQCSPQVAAPQVASAGKHAEAESTSQRDAEKTLHMLNLCTRPGFDSLECAWACHACKMYGVPLPTCNHEVTAWRWASFSNRRATTANATCYNMLAQPGSQGRLIPTISIWKCFHVAICERP